MFHKPVEHFAQQYRIASEEAEQNAMETEENGMEE